MPESSPQNQRALIYECNGCGRSSTQSGGCCSSGASLVDQALADVTPQDQEQAVAWRMTCRQLADCVYRFNAFPIAVKRSTIENISAQHKISSPACDPHVEPLCPAAALAEQRPTAADKARAELLSLERQAALLLLCELAPMYLRDGTRDCCEHCVGDLGAINLAQQWLEEDGRVDEVMGAIVNG